MTQRMRIEVQGFKKVRAVDEKSRAMIDTAHG